MLGFGLGLGKGLGFFCNVTVTSETHSSFRAVGLSINGLMCGPAAIAILIPIDGCKLDRGTAGYHWGSLVQYGATLYRSRPCLCCCYRTRQDRYLSRIYKWK